MAKNNNVIKLFLIYISPAIFCINVSYCMQNMESLAAAWKAPVLESLICVSLSLAEAEALLTYSRLSDAKERLISASIDLHNAHNMLMQKFPCCNFMRTPNSNPFQDIRDHLLPQIIELSDKIKKISDEYGLQIDLMFKNSKR